MAWRVEYTDTFGREANYSWVRRALLAHRENEGQGALMRRAKASVELSGARGRTVSHGDAYEFRPYRHCSVMFVTWDDWSEEAKKIDGE